MSTDKTPGKKTPKGHPAGEAFEAMRAAVREFVAAAYPASGTALLAIDGGPWYPPVLIQVMGDSSELVLENDGQLVYVHPSEDAP